MGKKISFEIGTTRFRHIGARSVSHSASSSYHLRLLVVLAAVIVLLYAFSAKPAPITPPTPQLTACEKIGSEAEQLASLINSPKARACTADQGCTHFSTGIGAVSRQCAVCVNNAHSGAVTALENVYAQAKKENCQNITKGIIKCAFSYTSCRCIDALCKESG